MSTVSAGAARQARTFHHSLYPPPRIAAERRQSVSVCLPARNCAETVGPIVRALLELREQGVLDEVVVLDAGSPDGTAAVAEQAGAKVLQEGELMSTFGGVLGKGDAMWRALGALEGELVCFLDADTEDFQAHFAAGLIGALVCEPEASFAKAFYRRPLQAPGEPAGEGGGRVNHLTARPALALFHPQLASIRQPLAGEVAARRDLLESIPFVTGYGVEAAMLIDIERLVGIERIVQVDLDEHHNPHQPLAALAPMAQTVLATISSRVHPPPTHAHEHVPVERPALAGLRGA